MTKPQAAPIALTVTWSNPYSARSSRIIAGLWLAVLALLAGLISTRAWSEDDPQKVLEARLARERNATELNNATLDARNEADKKAAREKLRNAQKEEDRKYNQADYKQKSMDNLASVKEIFAKAEESWKNQKYGEASQLYHSVVLATVPGAEEMVETSRGRLVELEDLAKGHLKSADDNDLKREYVKEVEELALVLKEFSLTKSYPVAQRRFITLRSRPEVAGYVELSQAEALETDDKLLEALAIYKSVAANPRYENTVPALKARRKLEELEQNEVTRTKIKTDMDAKADKEAPVLLASAKNYLLNNKPKQAMEKLQAVIDKFPNSKYAEEAKRQLAELK